MDNLVKTTCISVGEPLWAPFPNPGVFFLRLSLTCEPRRVDCAPRPRVDSVSTQPSKARREAPPEVFRLTVLSPITRVPRPVLEAPKVLSGSRRCEDLVLASVLENWIVRDALKKASTWVPVPVVRCSDRRRILTRTTQISESRRQGQTQETGPQLWTVRHSRI